MAELNKVMLMGNLTRDPQIKQLPSNTTVAEFGLAVSRRYKSATGESREETCFLDCAAFGKQAEVIGQYCRKGKPIFVEGRLKYEMWDDKQGLGRRNKVSVVVENFQFIGGRDESRPPISAPAQAPATREGGGQFEAADLTAARPRRQEVREPFAEETMFQEADIPF